MISYIYKYKNFLINISFYTLYYNIYSGACCCKKRPTQEQLIQLEIEKHNKLVKNIDNFFKKTNTKTKKCNNKKGYSLFENVNERNRINFKIRRATSSADFDKIIGIINSNEVLNEDIKKDLLEDVYKKKYEAEKKEDEFNKAKKAEIKNKEDIYNLYKTANYNQLDDLKDKLKANKGLFKDDELNKLNKSIESKGLEHEDNFINDCYANKNDLKLEDIDDLKKTVKNFKYIGKEKIENFINYLDNNKKELEDLEKAKQENEDKQNQIQNILNKINEIKNEFEESKKDCDESNLENLEKYKNKTIELKTRIDKINITGYEANLKNIKDNSTKEINEEKIKSAEKYIDNCIKLEDLDKVKLTDYDETDKKNLETKINSKRESLLQTFKNQFAKYLNYCNDHDINNIKNNDIIISIKKLPELKNIKNDTTNINEYMKDLNELKYHYILRKIGDINIVNNFTAEKFEFNQEIIDDGIRTTINTYKKDIEKLKKIILNTLKNTYKDKDKNYEYFKCVYKDTNKYYDDADYINKKFNKFTSSINNFIQIGTITINEDKYVIYCNYGNFKIKKCIAKNGGLKIMDEKTVNGTPINNIKENENLKFKFIIAYVRQFENTNS